MSETLAAGQVPAADSTARALDLFVKLMRAQRSVMAAVEPSILASGLTPTQFGVLEALFHKGPLCHGDLKEKVLTSAANLTDVIDKLEARALVTRRRESCDARKICVALTPSGHDLVAAIFPPHAAEIARVIGALPASDQAKLAELLRRLGLAAETARSR
jgi:MarR family 2-MHQ and catechol resistance regulon transcriptional repressor